MPARGQPQAGIPIYDGNAEAFDEWEFKVLGHVHSIKNQADLEDKTSIQIMEIRLADLSAKACGRVEGEALRVAMEIGHEELQTKDGIQKLVDAIKSSEQLANSDPNDTELHLASQVPEGSDTFTPLVACRARDTGNSGCTSQELEGSDAFTLLASCHARDMGSSGAGLTQKNQG